MTHQADDMPAHAIMIMNAVIQLFPDQDRADLVSVFVDNYFRQWEGK